MENLVWNVFVEKVNTNKIEVHNVFEHARFMNDLVKIKRKYKDFGAFSKEVNATLAYYYRSKCEWETVITSFPPYIDNEELENLNKERSEAIKNYGRFIRTYINLETAEKVDVYRQVKMNWERFIEYLWNNRKLIKHESITQ